MYGSIAPRSSRADVNLLPSSDSDDAELPENKNQPQVRPHGTQSCVDLLAPVDMSDDEEEGKVGHKEEIALQKTFSDSGIGSKGKSGSTNGKKEV